MIVVQGNLRTSVVGKAEDNRWPWPSLSATLHLFASFSDLGWIKLFPATQLAVARGFLLTSAISDSFWLAASSHQHCRDCFPTLLAENRCKGKSNGRTGLDRPRARSIHPSMTLLSPPLPPFLLTTTTQSYSHTTQSTGNCANNIFKRAELT